MTSAPKSASIAPQDGTITYCANSTTRTPANIATSAIRPFPRKTKLSLARSYWPNDTRVEEAGKGFDGVRSCRQGRDRRHRLYGILPEFGRQHADPGIARDHG